MISDAEKFEVLYLLAFQDGHKEAYEIVAEMPDMSLPEPEQPSPDWTRLDYHKCSNCPLQETDTPTCPVAVQLVDVSRRFGNRVSFDKVTLEVVSSKRRVIVETDVQGAVRSLMGLIMALSDCPHMAFFKPLARFHLPLGDMEETIVRSMSFYLLAEHYKHSDPAKRDPDFAGLLKIYQQVGDVNHGIAERLRAAGVFSELNSIVELDNLSQALAMTIEGSLFDLGALFHKHP